MCKFYGTYRIEWRLSRRLMGVVETGSYGRKHQYLLWPANAVIFGMKSEFFGRLRWMAWIWLGPFCFSLEYYKRKPLRIVR